MVKYIAVTSSVYGNCLVFTDRIAFIGETSDEVTIYFSARGNDHLVINESVDEVADLLMKGDITVEFKP